MGEADLIMAMHAELARQAEDGAYFCSPVVGFDSGSGKPCDNIEAAEITYDGMIDLAALLRAVRPLIAQEPA